MESLENQFTFLEKLTRSLLLKQKIDSTLSSLQKKAQKIRDYYEPRTEFNRWKQTLEGKAWKTETWTKQKKCCAECKREIHLKGSHIDHIKPISSYPELNMALSNLRVTCAECNEKKGNREVDPSSC